MTARNISDGDESYFVFRILICRFSARRLGCFCYLVLAFLDALACCQADYEIGVVRLNGCLVGSTVANNGTALVAPVDNDIAALWVGLCLDGAEDAAAAVCSVAGVDIHVQRAETEGAVVAGGVAQGEHLLAAVLADEAVVILGKSFSLHISSLGRFVVLRTLTNE